ncbi:MULTISPECIES: YciI family protein [unclassified Phenylobacterium]|uniref:YciI family protein n=1 Tax=unclassified Phenylobacterium TaxID=2640670 RepID=UPI00083A6CCB|nr:MULTISPECIES: YciI family protein [unclassified Phenylobacterium]
MPDFIFLHHDDASGDGGLDWDPYLTRLREAGVFQGGSAIGQGHCVKKSGAAPEPTAHISSFVRVTAKDLEEARGLLSGNPVFEAGGTVEIRELPLG